MKHKIGINTFLFASPFTNKEVSLFSKFKSWGFDGVELAIEDPAHIDPELRKKAAGRSWAQLYFGMCGDGARQGPKGHR